MPPTLKTIRHFKSECGTGAELRPEIVSWIVTDDAPVSLLANLFLVPSNFQRSLRKSTRPSFLLVSEVANENVPVPYPPIFQLILLS